MKHKLSTCILISTLDARTVIAVPTNTENFKFFLRLFVYFF